MTKMSQYFKILTFLEWIKVKVQSQTKISSVSIQYLYNIVPPYYIDISLKHVNSVDTILQKPTFFIDPISKNNNKLRYSQYFFNNVSIFYYQLFIGTITLTFIIILIYLNVELCCFRGFGKYNNDFNFSFRFYQRHIDGVGLVLLTICIFDLEQKLFAQKKNIYVLKQNF